MRRRCRVLVTDPLPEEIFRSQLAPATYELQFRRPDSTTGPIDIWVTRHAFKISRSILELGKSRGLKWIIQAASGTDNIDLPAARALGIHVEALAGLNAITASEHTLALLLALRKRLLLRNLELQSGGWDRTPFECELSGQTLGVLGLGYVGARVAALGSAFGMRVVAYDPQYPAEVPWKKLHAWPTLPSHQQALLKTTERVSRVSTVLRQAAILSLHFPADRKNQNWLNAKRIAALPEGALVINCARGEIADSTALVKALKSGAISGIGLDVFDSEPPSRASPFFTDPKVQEKVLTTSHVGGASTEAQERLAFAASARIRAISKGVR